MGVLKSHGRQGPPPCPAAIEAGPLPPLNPADLVPPWCRMPAALLVLVLAGG